MDKLFDANAARRLTKDESAQLSESISVLEHQIANAIRRACNNGERRVSIRNVDKDINSKLVGSLLALLKEHKYNAAAYYGDDRAVELSINWER